MPSNETPVAWKVGLDHRWLPGGDEIVMLRDQIVGDGETALLIPIIYKEDRRKGFVLDGGTSPGFSWPIIGHPFGRYLPAYGGHDYRWAFRNRFPGMSFGDTNDILYTDILELGNWYVAQGRKLNPKRDAWLHYQAVQLFGKSLWSKKNHIGDEDWHYQFI